MKDKIMVCFDKAQRETALQLQNVIDTMVSAAGIFAMCQCYEEMDKTCCDVNIIFLLLPDLNEESKRTVVEDLFDWMSNQHLFVVPLTDGTPDQKITPPSIGKHHILSIEDPNLHEKIMRILQNETHIFDEIKEIARLIASNKLSIKDCTAKQLFQWAIAQFYGIETDQKISESLCLFRVLVGNDAFVPSSIDVSILGRGKQYIGELLNLCRELESYLEYKIPDALQSKDYRDALLFTEYSQLMKNISSSCLFNFNTDNALWLTRTVLLEYFKEDNSLKAGKWLLEYLLSDAERKADNRDYLKMIELLFRVLMISERLWVSYHDIEVLSFLCTAVYTLAFYKAKREDIIDHIICNEITDDREDDGTFRPPYREIERDLDMKIELSSLSDQFLNGDIGCRMIQVRLETLCGQKQSAVFMLASLFKATQFLLMCKAARSDDSFAVWYTSEMKRLTSCESELAPKERKSLQLIALYTCSNVLRSLQNPYYRASDENLLVVSQLLITLFDLDPNQFTAMGLDKSEPYSLVACIYEEAGNYEKADEAYQNLFEIVAERDKNDENTIKKMLKDIYDILQMRKKIGMQDAYEAYVRFSWGICCKDSRVPREYCNAFLEELKTFMPITGLLSDEEIIEYKKSSPEDPKEEKRIYPLAYKEIYEIMNRLDDESYSMISSDFISVIRSKMNIHHPFEIDESRDLSEQDFLHLTRVVLQYMWDHFLSGN